MGGSSSRRLAKLIQSRLCPHHESQANGRTNPFQPKMATLVYCAQMLFRTLGTDRANVTLAHVFIRLHPIAEPCMFFEPAKSLWQVAMELEAACVDLGHKTCPAI